MQVVPWLFVIGLASGWLLNARYAPWPNFYGDAGLAVAWLLALAVMTFGRLRSSSFALRLTIPVTVWPVLVCIAIIWIQFGAGTILWSGDAWMPTALLGGFALAQMLGAAASQTGYPPDFWESLFANACVAAGLLSVGLAWMQWLGVTPLGLWMVEMPARQRPGANLAQANHLSMLLLWGLASLAYLHSTSRRWRPWAFPASAVICSGLALTDSRFVWIALLAWLVCVLREQEYGWFRRRVPMFLALIAVYLVTYGSLHLVALSENAGAATLGSRLFSTARIPIWNQMLEALWQRPLLGWGWNQVVVAQYHEASASGVFAYNYATNAHSGILDLALWSGLPFAILLLGGSVVWFWKKQACLVQARSRYAWVCLLMILSYCLFEFPYEYGYFLWPAGWLMGRLDRCGNADKPTAGVYPGLLAGVLVLALCFWGTIVHEYIYLEQDFERMLFEGRGISSMEPIAPSQPIRVLTHLEAYIAEERVALADYKSASDMQRLERVTARYPFPSLLEKHAMLLVRQGELEVARQEMLKIGYLFGARPYQRARLRWQEMAAHSQSELAAVDLPQYPPPAVTRTPLR